MSSTPAHARSHAAEMRDSPAFGPMDQDMPRYVTRRMLCRPHTAVLLFPAGDPPTGAATTPAARPPARRGRDATRCWRARANSTRTPRSPVAYYVPHPPPYTRAWWCLPRGRRVAEVPEAGGHQRSSEVISGHQSSTRGYRWHALAIGGTRSGTRWHAVAIGGNQH